MSKDKIKKAALFGRLGAFFKETVSLPSDAFSSGFGIEMRGRRLLFLSGCQRIIKYTTTEMVFSAKGSFVTVVGKELICTTFHGGTVTVEGRIDGINFGEEREE